MATQEQLNQLANISDEQMAQLLQILGSNPTPVVPVQEQGEVQVPTNVIQSPVESGAHLEAAPMQAPVQQFQAPQYTPVYAQAPQRQVSTSMKCQGGSTNDLLDAFRACGRAVNGGNDVNHQLQW